MSRESIDEKKIGVLMGGWSRERAISLKSGQRIFQSLERQGFKVVPIDVDRDIAGVLKEEEIEVAFIALHGRPGEDGTIQGVLETLGIKYTGSGVLSSALALDKVMSKKIFELTGIPTPPYLTLLEHEDLDLTATRAIRELKMPLVVKPRAEGSSIGVEIADQETGFREMLSRLRESYGDLLIESFMEGMTVTVGVLGTDPAARALPVLELIPTTRFYDYEAKYTKGATEFVIPARLPEKTYKATQGVAVDAHNVLLCRGFSRVDMMVSSEGQPWVLEVNTMPGMTELSDLPAEAEAEGMDYDGLVREMLGSATQ